MIAWFFLPIVVALCGFVIYPLLQKSTDAPQTGADDRLQDVLHRRQALANSVDDLDFDRATGKLSLEDFDAAIAEIQRERHDLDVQMKNLVGMTEAELTAKLEREINELRGAKPPAAAVCPACGKALSIGDRFCPACGQKIS